MISLILAAVSTMNFSFGEVSLECADPGEWKLSLSREVAEDGSEIALVHGEGNGVSRPPVFTIKTSIPQNDATDLWTVDTGDCAMPPIWASWAWGRSETAVSMPLYVFFNNRDEAVFSAAASECMRRLVCKAGVIEEGDRLGVEFVYFEGDVSPLEKYETSVRFVNRHRPFAAAVREDSRWISKAAGVEPCKVPESAFDPLYSTWYGFHQNVFAADIEAECALAAELGMKTIILDDGWQTDDNRRGYAYCGDWQVSKRRFPDFAAHVKKVQAMGIKYMVWYAVPFIGRKSANYEKFKGKYLMYNCKGLGAAVLDPRFPEVRKFLVDLYVKAMEDWNLDGFKLDFIDSFRFEGEDPAVKENYAGRDEKSVPVAVNRLMTEVKTALTAIKPDILIEFRQRYDGPAIRQYGNMIRVGDCPGNMRRNRFAIANLRLACGDTAVHSDMLEWNYAEAPDKSALYIINSIFGVVQYSMMLRDAPPRHREMIGKWLRFSQQHRKTLLGGCFTPHHPELGYPLIEAESDDERIIGLYDNGRVIELPEDEKPTYVMNASGSDTVTVRRGGILAEYACPSGDFIRLAPIAR